MMVTKWSLASFVLLMVVVVGLFDNGQSIHIFTVPELTPSQVQNQPACKALIANATVPANQATVATTTIEGQDPSNYCQRHIVYLRDPNTNLLNDTLPCLCIDGCISWRLGLLKLATTPEKYSEANFKLFRCVNKCSKQADHIRVAESTNSTNNNRQNVPEWMNEKYMIDYLLNDIENNKMSKKLLDKLKETYEADQKNRDRFDYVQFCERSDFVYSPPLSMADACWKHALMSRSNVYMAQVVEEIIACRHYMRCFVARVKAIVLAKQCCLTGRYLDDHMKHYICARDTYQAVKRFNYN